MKRQSFTLLLLATLMALVLSACGGGAPQAPEAPAESPTTAPATDQPTDAPTAAESPAATAVPAATSPATSASGFTGTLQFWVLGYQPGGGNRTGELMDAAVGAFMAANPDITVEITGYSGDQAGFTKLTQTVQGGQAVDVFRLPSDVLPLLVKDELVASIDEFLTEEDRADIYPNQLQAVSNDGQA
jgi:multiple sugar transport system substrate-binding protein